MRISKKEFESFETLRESGVINMNDVKEGCRLSGLTRDRYLEIKDSYDTYREKFSRPQ